MPKTSAPISNQLRELGRRLTQFGQSHPPRSRLPEQFWDEAMSVAHDEGLYRTARTLHVDYANLKRRVERSSQRKQGALKTSRSTTGTLKRSRTGSRRQLPAQASTRTTPPTAFVELMADSLATNCLIEVEGAGGTRLRIQKRMSAPEVLRLVRDWREGLAGGSREGQE